MKGSEPGESGVKRVGVGVADARNDVPVVARQAGQGERRARGDDVQAAPWIERVGEAEQVVLVGATAMVEDEHAVGPAGRRTFAVGERAHVVDPTSTRRLPGFG